MKRIWNIVVQSTAILGQTVVPSLPVAEDIRNVIHASIAAIQGIAAVIAHNSNPDGTPASVPYMKTTNLLDGGDR